MNPSELSSSAQLQHDLQSLASEMRDELQRLNLSAQRGDSLAVASIAYRVRNVAKNRGMRAIADGAARIEESARKNNVTQFTSDIQLLDHQVRWVSQTAPQPF